MVKLIRLIVLIAIGYFIVQLIATKDSDAQQWQCAFGDDFTVKYDVGTAISQREAEHKARQLQPDSIHDVRCMVNEQ